MYAFSYPSLAGCLRTLLIIQACATLLFSIKVARMVGKVAAGLVAEALCS